MELSELQQIRQDKAQALRERGIEPYPTRAHRTTTTAVAIARFDELERDGALGDGHDPEAITVAGRIVSFRHMGKTVFAHIRDGHGQLQLYLRKDNLGDEAYADLLKLFDIGDFVEATGALFRTKAGEVSLRATSIRMLAKALNAPPEKWHGLSDIETRYRQRYVDLLANEEVRRVFTTRAKTITALRHFLDRRGYLEVETPTLQPLYGGAAARPFTTHHHALDQTFYLRIADELYLKRLLVGGYERVYEICKDFRNEGIDRNHSPEFTMLEFYEAYGDYESMMETVEAMIVQAAQEVLGTLQLTYQGKEIDLTPPWRRITLRDAIKEFAGIDYVEYPDQASLLKAARAAGADIETGTVWPRIVDELLKQFVRPNLIQPTFLIDYPVELSPLAKRKPDDPTHVERFQPQVAGAIELGNAFTELNDPLDQLARFLEQQKDREAGDEEAMPIDIDYVTALMYGMPPTGGVGIGIDRLVMLFTDQPTLRDVILFPAMRRLPSDDGQHAPSMAAGQHKDSGPGAV
ncbi:MAG TPA: lysine--tRNA ligase [Candidatus Limnocylindria bacterium]|nr:lysine--tRNA ligase [Candidatus Limnocylindria bacterium]